MLYSYMIYIWLHCSSATWWCFIGGTVQSSLDLSGFSIIRQRCAMFWVLLDEPPKWPAYLNTKKKNIRIYITKPCSYLHCVWWLVSYAQIQSVFCIDHIPMICIHTYIYIYLYICICIYIYMYILHVYHTKNNPLINKHGYGTSPLFDGTTHCFYGHVP